MISGLSGCASTPQERAVFSSGLCFLLGSDLSQSILVCGGTFQEVLNKDFQGIGTLKGETELHLSYFREPQAGRDLGRPLNPFLYGEIKQLMGISLI